MRHAALRLAIIFAAVPLLFMTALLGLPAVGGVVRSFDANGPSLNNYRTLLGDHLFWVALANNLIVPAGSLVLEFAAGLGLAMFLTSRQRGSAILEAAAILPFAIPEIVILTLARFIFIPRGYLNGALGAVGIGPLPWLLPNHWLKLATVIAVDAWHVTPVVMLILMAGLQTIPKELYEAARLDGAGKLSAFRHVTIPMLAPALLGALVLRGVDALRIFSTTLLLTGAEGVPVLSTCAYQLYDDAQQPNLAMAASMILALLITLIATAGFALARSRPAPGAIA